MLKNIRIIDLKAHNPNCSGKRLCRLGNAALKAKIGHGLQGFRAKPPFSTELLVGLQNNFANLNLEKMKYIVLCISWVFIVLVCSGCWVSDHDVSEFYNANMEIGTPIISAILDYEKDNLQWPNALADLVPKYLGEIPNTTKDSDFGYMLSDEYVFTVSFSLDDQLGCFYIGRLKIWECTPNINLRH